MSIDTHEPVTSHARRTGRRHALPWTLGSRGSATPFRFQQVAALGVAIGVLVALTATGAQAGESGHHGVRHTSAQREAAARHAELASLHALSNARFDMPASQFDPHRHHRRHPLSPPTTPPTTPTTLPQGPPPTFPVGIADASQPSGMAPPASDAMPGYTQSYESNFPGSSVPGGWDVFTGNPGGDPGAQWGAAHVTVSGGILSLNTWKDPAYGDEWVAGGLCQCGVAHTYGAYFVRSRVTGAGPTQVELLWPTGSWPPEIDFNETDGGVGHTTATVHFDPSNDQDQRSVGIDMTQWHTWGVIWTPTSITYTVDGRVWGSIHNTAEIPNVPMTLDLTQQTWCSAFWACPTAPESVQVDWVAEYAPS